jgi:hypothetical protein
MIRPTWATVSSENAAKPADILQKSVFLLANSWDEGCSESIALCVPLLIGLIDVSSVISGGSFFSIILVSAHSRSAA